MRRACVVIALVATLAACAGVEGGDEDAALHVVHPSAEPTGLDGIVEGVVETDASTRCTWLEGGDGERLTIVWPAGTTANDDLSEIRLPNGDVVRRGDWVSGGGGYVPVDHGAWGDVPDSCANGDVVAMFNSTADVRVGTE